MYRLKQSISWWCFAQGEISPQTFIRAVADIGYEGIELVDQAYWPLIKEHGLSIVSTNAGLSIEQGLSDQVGIEITAEGLSSVAQAAEDAGVTLAIELLNTDPLPASSTGGSCFSPNASRLPCWYTSSCWEFPGL